MKYRRNDSVISITIKQFILIAAFTVLANLFLVGCGSNAEVETYKNQMDDFFNSMGSYNEQINALDPSSPDSVAELLVLLSQMNQSITEMSAYPVPEHFSSIKPLADGASENMQAAVDLYQEVLTSETFNQSKADAAFEYYKRACVRLQYMIDIMHGEVPAIPGSDDNSENVSKKSE